MRAPADPAAAPVADPHARPVVAPVASLDACLGADLDAGLGADLGACLGAGPDAHPDAHPGACLGAGSDAGLAAGRAPGPIDGSTGESTDDVADAPGVAPGVPSDVASGLASDADPGRHSGHRPIVASDAASGLAPDAAPDVAPERWSDPVLVAAILAVAPAGLGVHLRASPGPARDRWLALLRDALPADRPLLRCPPGIGDDRLLGGLDPGASLASRRRVAGPGLLGRCDNGVLLLPMAERASPELAARLGGALDTGELVLERDAVAAILPARFALVALDEGLDDDPPPPPALLERLAFGLSEAGLAASELAAGGPDAAPPGLRDAVQRARARLDRAAAPGAVPDAVTDAVAGAVPNAVPGVVPDGVPDAVAGAVPNVVPGAVAGAVRNAVPGVVPDAVTDAVAGAVRNAVPGAVPDAVPDTVAGVVPDAVAGAVAGAVPNAVPDTVAGAVRDAVPGVVPDGVPDTVPDAMLDAVPDAVAGAVPNAVPGAVPDAVPDTVAGVVRDAVAGAVHDATLGAVPDAVADALCRTAVLAGIGSLRAPLLALRVARIVAALCGRDRVGDADAAIAARLVLGPRASMLPDGSDADGSDAVGSDAAGSAPDGSVPDGSMPDGPARDDPAPDRDAAAGADAPAGDAASAPSREDEAPDGACRARDRSAARPGADHAGPRRNGNADEGPGDDTAAIVLRAVRAAIAPDLLERLRSASSANRPSAASRAAAGRTEAGRASRRAPAARGRPIGALAGDPSRGRLDVLATLRAALPWQALRSPAATAPAPADGRAGSIQAASIQAGSIQAGSIRAGSIRVRREDFRLRRFAPRLPLVTLFVVDASGSAARARLAEAKGCVSMLLADCYARRDRVALLAVRDRDAVLVLPPTGSVLRARRALDRLPGGGGTPLAAGLDAVARLAERIRRDGAVPLLVLLTDGRANVARDGAPGRERAMRDALEAARQLRTTGLPSLLVDISPRARQGAAPEAVALAAALGARCLALPADNAAALAREAAALGARQRAALSRASG